MKRLFNSQWRKLVPVLFVAVLLGAAGNAAQAQVAEPITRIRNIEDGGGNLTISPPVDPTKPENWLVVGTKTTTTNMITVSTNYNGTITLKDVKIVRSGTAIDIAGNTNVTLKLMGENYLESTYASTTNSPAVLKIQTTTHLTIESYNGIDADGKLTVKQYPTSYSAAIGTNYIGDRSGYITINSGTIYTTAGDDGAGIGGGSERAGGYITINGGNVTAISDSRAGSANSGAGIGAGYKCSDLNTYIRINGGTVTAVSLIKPLLTLSGSAIGTGNNSSGFGYIIIAGGTVRASVRSFFTDDGRPMHPDKPGQALHFDDNNSGISGLWYETPADDYSGSLGGSYSVVAPDGYMGRDGCGIGGGASTSPVTGTIIILPSANVQRVYGGINPNNKDIGTCSQLFYLNKTPLRVGLGATDPPVLTRLFTAGTQDFQVGADIYAHINIADQYLPASASKIGTTKDIGSGVGLIGLSPTNGDIPTDTAYYYTNSSVQFFTDAKTTSNEPFKIVYRNNSDHLPYENAPYNIGISTAYNLVDSVPSTPSSYDFMLSEGWTTSPVPLPPTTPLNETDITLNFGNATYSRLAIVPGVDFKRSMAHYIGNTGNQWFEIEESSSSTVESFELAGPVVAPPEVEDGTFLPIGTTDSVRIRVKERVSVGLHEEKLIFTATNPTNSADVKTRTVTLQLKVDKLEVNDDAEAKLTAITPAPPTPPDSTKTNSSTVNLRARAVAADIDGVTNVWIKIDSAATCADYSIAAGLVPVVDGINGWKLYPAAPDANGKFSPNLLLSKVPFPEADTTYYIYWFVETVNTIGARGGTIGPYTVDRHRPEPTITGPAAVGLSPFTARITFDREISGLTAEMFSVSNAAINLASLTAITPGTEYTLQITPNGNGPVTLTLPQNMVQDSYTNRNIEGTYTVPYYDGIPVADFSTIDTVYFALPSAVPFSVASGSGSNLYANDMTLIDNSNPLRTFTMLKDGGAYIPSVAYSGNTFTLSGLATGEYAIHIAADSIRNEIGSGIKDTAYIFKVYNLDWSSADGTVVFGPEFEGYAALTPYTGAIINNGTLAVPGLSFTLGSSAAFNLSPSGQRPLLGGGNTASYTVSPKTGLLLGDYIDTVTVRYYDRVLAELEVKFSVTKRPPPAADIDYINELLISLLDGQYSFNHANPVTVRGAAGWPIPDAWMTDDDLINEQIDATGHASFPQLLLIPQRPAAPANLTVRPSNFGWDDGEIYGLNDSMEYKLETADKWTPVPVGAISLVDLPPGMYLVRYKAIYNEAFSSVIAPMRVSDWVLPDITREVHLPEAAGTTVQPSPGVHYVRSSNDFAFILQFSGTPLMVRTNRYTDGIQEELTGIPDAFGGYVYTIRRVTEQIYVYIGPETVGNLAVDGVSLWAYRGMIHIETLHEETADIYTIAGRLVQRVKAPEGVTSVSVAPGVYIVVLKSGRTGKVIVN